MDFDIMRKRMVAEQLISRGISDTKVLEAMKKVPRHRFVPDKFKEAAYDDHPLPIGFGQTISQPYMVALMTESLELTGNEKVLEIGTGSGYQAAILSELVKEVYSIEKIEPLVQYARDNLDALGYTNVKIKTGDGTIGWQDFSPYEAIIVTAGAPKIPQGLIDQLTPDGRMVVPVGGSFSQVLTLVRKKDQTISTQDLCGCMFVPLIGKDGWRA